MARKGITKDMVEDAIIQIKNEGETPTTKTIREKLGTGSMSTISKFLNEHINGGELDPDLFFDIEDALSVVEEETISEFLSNEHPQMIAAILAQLKPDVTARILGSYGSNKAEDIIERIEKLNPIQQRIMSTIDKTIREEMKAFATVAETMAGGTKFANEVRAALKGSK